MRTGVIAQKMGMTRLLDDSGRHIPVTVFKMDSCQVVSVAREEAGGVNAVEVGVGQAKVKNVSKPMRGHFAKAKVEPKRVVRSFRVAADGILNVGDEILPSHFIEDQFVDAVGISKGKGFAGAMKRHNFSGLRASHGVSIAHRSHGSTGQCQDPGKVFKGKKMAGHLGSERVTIQNLKVVSTNDAEGLILVKGAVPGANGSYIMLRDAMKKNRPEAAPYPAALKKSAAGPVENTTTTQADEKPTSSGDGVQAAEAEPQSADEQARLATEKPEAASQDMESQGNKEKSADAESKKDTDLAE